MMTCQVAMHRLKQWRKKAAVSFIEVRLRIGARPMTVPRWEYSSPTVQSQSVPCLEYSELAAVILSSDVPRW
eukprot:95126-Prorocentrum_minimum.AAC.3